MDNRRVDPPLAFEEVACADGQKVYLGSANSSTAGLASRCELDFLLEGTRISLVSSFAESPLRMARVLQVR